MEACQQVKKVTAAGEPRRQVQRRFLRAATAVAHLCGLRLSQTRYIERSPVVIWATFHLKQQMSLKNDLLFNKHDFSKNLSQKKGFEKLKLLLCVCPKQRRQQDLLQIQACLKMNRAFQGLPGETQLQLCHVLVYQKYEARTIILRQGHVATECYLVVSGTLKVTVAGAASKNKTFTHETLCEAEAGDLIGETCLLTNTKRPASIICKSDAELLVIGKEDFVRILADVQGERHRTTCQFLSCNQTISQNVDAPTAASNQSFQSLLEFDQECEASPNSLAKKLPIFSTWPQEKIDFLVHCSLRRFYRAGTTVVLDSFNCYFLVIVKLGRCVEAAKLDKETISTQNGLQREDDRRIKRTPRQKKATAMGSTLAPRFLKIRTLGQSDIFGLADLTDKLCGLQLSLISEGAECIFIPKKLFQAEAPTVSKQIALETAESSYPTKNMIRDSDFIQQAWTSYKIKLIEQHLDRCAKPVKPSISGR